MGYMAPYSYARLWIYFDSEYDSMHSHSDGCLLYIGALYSYSNSNLAHDNRHNDDQRTAQEKLHTSKKSSSLRCIYYVVIVSSNSWNFLLEFGPGKEVEKKIAKTRYCIHLLELFFVTVM